MFQNCFFFCEELHWYFDVNYTESVNQLGCYGHFMIFFQPMSIESLHFLCLTLFFKCCILFFLISYVDCWLIKVFITLRYVLSTKNLLNDFYLEWSWNFSEWFFASTRWFFDFHPAFCFDALYSLTCPCWIILASLG